MVNLLKNNFPVIVAGRRAELVRRLLLGSIFWEGLKFYGNPLKTYYELKRIQKLRQSAHGNKKIAKFVKSGHVYHWVTDYAGYPSENLRQLIRTEFRRNGSENSINSNVKLPQQTIIWSITNRCPLSCNHCCEWDNRDKRDHLSLAQLQQILLKIEQQGIRHVQLGGGEPLVRFSDTISLVNGASDRIDFWLLTSGWGLAADKAHALKEAGLRGVHISLDHWDETAHNHFRNNPKSYEWAMKATKNCLKAGLIVSLSLCATRDFVTQENLEYYANLARNLGVHFIRILEPGQTGRFSGQEVSLSNQQIELLSRFSIRMNSDPSCKDFPIVTFFGHHQRKLGCMGAGNRYLYIDADGDFHACPFCRGSEGNALTGSFNEAIGRLRKKGCHAFKTVMEMAE